VIRRTLLAALSCLLLASGLAVAPADAATPSRQQWLSDVDQAMYGSQRYVDRRVSSGGSMLAVNFDIDNTALATYYDGGGPVVRVLRFAKHARGKGVRLLFNTGRISGDGRLQRAKRQLTRAGYVVTEVCGRTSSHETLTHSKQRCRRHFVAEGYTLIANVGNRSTDFAGVDNYEKAFHLPNYGNQLG